MLTLHDVYEIVNDDRKLGQWLAKYKILVPAAAECPKCGARMRFAEHRGRPGMTCSSKDCRKRVSAVAGGILEGSQLSPKDFLLLAYFWAHDCGGVRSVEMLGHSSATVAIGLLVQAVCVLNQQDATVC